jgi:hypothetical protein
MHGLRDESGVVGWVLVGILIGLALAVWLVVQLFGALF